MTFLAIALTAVSGGTTGLVRGEPGGVVPLSVLITIAPLCSVLLDRKDRLSLQRRSIEIGQHARPPRGDIEGDAYMTVASEACYADDELGERCGAESVGYPQTLRT